MRFSIKVKGAHAVEFQGPRGTMRLSLKDGGLRDLLMLLEGETAGASITELARRCGYRSPATYYRKRRLLREGGLSALLAQKRGPRAKSRLTDAVVRKIVSTRVRFPAMNAAEIAVLLRLDGARVSARSVERALLAFGISRSRRSFFPHGAPV